MDMCRFASRHDTGYQQVMGELRSLVDTLEEKAKFQKIQGLIRHGGQYASY
jgi:hypothetical protein